MSGARDAVMDVWRVMEQLPEVAAYWTIARAGFRKHMKCVKR